MAIKGNFAYKIDIGRIRLVNEDQAFAISNSKGDVLMVVCDGLGGHNKGDYASRVAIDIMKNEFQQKSRFLSLFTARLFIINAIKKANRKIFQESEENEIYKGMGTTIVACLIIKKWIIIYNVGDSRAYKVSKDKMEQLTIDQSVVDYLRRTGQITSEEAKNHPQKHVLMNALGLFPSVSLDFTIKQYDKSPIFLCSDGVYNNISTNELFAILSTDETVNQKVDTVIQVANYNGGSDNLAACLWEVESDD